MFNLKDNIENWRNRLEQKEVFQKADLDELESHLVEEMEGLADSALTQEERFLIATRRLGDTEAIANEFAKVNRKAIVLHRLLWMAGGVLAFNILNIISSAIGSLASFFVTYLCNNGYYWGISQFLIKGVCFIAGFILVFHIYKTGILHKKLKYYSSTRKRKLFFTASFATFYVLLLIGYHLIHIFIYSVGKFNINELSRLAITTTLFSYLGTILFLIFLLIFVISKVGKTQKA